MNEDLAALTVDYWRKGITDITPGSIRVRGYAIEQLIGAVSFQLPGGPSVFVTRPIPASLVAITVAILIVPPLLSRIMRSPVKA